MAGEIKFDITRHFGTISSRGVWTKEVNLVGWNGRDPKIDIREWSEEHTKMTKGVNFTKEDAIKLRDILNSIDFDSIN